MGATSVTGVSGSGSVQDAIFPGGWGQGKGSEHMSLGVNRLVGPRVVCAGTVALVGGTATVQLPDLVDYQSLSLYTYLAVATDTTAAAAVQAVLTFPSASGSYPEPYLTLTGTGTHTIAWTVIKGNN